MSESIVILPVVVSAASALRKFPPANTVADVFVVPETFIDDAYVVAPANIAPSVEFKVIPALIVANPVCVALGVNVSFDSIATLVAPAYIEETTLFPPELANVSIFQPDSVCPAVKAGPTNSNLSFT